MSKADTFARQEANHPDAGASAQQYPQPPPAYADVDRDDMNDPLLPRSSNDNVGAFGLIWGVGGIGD